LIRLSPEAICIIIRLTWIFGLMKISPILWILIVILISFLFVSKRIKNYAFKYVDLLTQVH